MTPPRTARADSAHQTAQADTLRETVIAELGELKTIRSDRVAVGFRAAPRGSTRPSKVTSAADGRDHLVSVGLAAAHGTSVALCGRRVVAAPPIVPPGPTCFDCETALHRVTVGGNTSYRHCGLIARLLRRLSSRTGSRALFVGKQLVGKQRAVRA